MSCLSPCLPIPQQPAGHGRAILGLQAALSSVQGETKSTELSSGTLHVVAGGGGAGGRILG